MFIPSEWSKERNEPKTQQDKAYLHYLYRFVMGLYVPDWMIDE